MSFTKKALLVVTAVCLIPVVVFGVTTTINIYRWVFSPYLEREIAGPVTITSEWQEITPPKSLRAERQVQYVMFDITTSYEPSPGAYGLRLRDGSVVTPEVQVVDQYGNLFDLKLRRLGKAGMGFISENDLPRDRAYRAVRVRCDKPIQCSRVYWYCYNSWDMN